MIIYKITNLINNKVYIGQTKRSLSVRWTRHVADAKNRQTALSRAINKYGSCNFQIEPVIKCNSLEEMNHREKMCIRLFNSRINGYNILSGGENRDFDKETLKKISEANKIAWSNPLYKENMCLKRKNGSLKRYRSPFNVYKAIKIRSGGNKPYSYSKGDFVGTWNNQIDCANSLNLEKKSISACLNKKIKTHKDYIFERIEEN